jgi:hypothetical protein
MAEPRTWLVAMTARVAGTEATQTPDEVVLRLQFLQKFPLEQC